jgi:hypothetical protein
MLILRCWANVHIQAESWGRPASPDRRLAAAWQLQAGSLRRRARELVAVALVVLRRGPVVVPQGRPGVRVQAGAVPRVLRQLAAAGPAK